ncbi:MAG: class I SAM-dependent methyltransferase [Azospirillaceae bacterium]
MTGFDADWLALREPADAAARSVALADRAASHLAARHLDAERPLRILDLGAGTGSGPRWLAPRLPGPQRWTLVDHDPALLAEAPRALAGWAEARGLEAETSAGLRLSGPGLDVTVETRRHDLNAALETLPFDEADLATGAALLDLVSESWIARLARAAAGRPILVALTVDGLIDFAPTDPLDGPVRDAFNGHQHGDKGFGPALGPAAASRAPAMLAEAGWHVETEATPWRLGPDQGPLIAALVEGYAATAAEMAVAPEREIAAWRDRRRESALAGTLSLTVGHIDLLALPDTL